MEGPSGGGPSLKSAINVTPLADVMLVLLIIFMVVTPMMDAGVAVAVPKAEHASEHPDGDDTLVVSLRGDRTVHVNEDAIDPVDLEVSLTSILADRSNKALWLKANEQLDYGYVLEMMDRCRNAGATEVALITKATADEEETADAHR